MTIKQVIILCRALGIYCKWNANYQEFCIWPKGTNAEATAYFTDDRYDAVYTAVWMANEVRQKRTIGEFMTEIRKSETRR